MSKVTESFDIAEKHINEFNQIFIELSASCIKLVKDPTLKLPRVLPTALKKNNPDSIFIVTLNSQGFFSKNWLKVYAEDFCALGLSVIGINKV
ncbi:hypothetical protein DSO57_1006165 [Entomophthora muscae]|uniref:Uncharacterized protein n=1 Tax=Entomophthora muscae TaxID=34485 RepID=A0ACC2UTL4_9FUNG|nr:hypothetical protein DSO57_1006165 [Entomophthora muscae]